MFWNEREHRWEKHPECRCDHDPCTCRWLRPLDAEGKSLPAPMWDAMPTWDAMWNALFLIPRGLLFDDLLAALKQLRLDANRLCDRNLGGTYEEDCRRSITAADIVITRADALRKVEEKR